MFSTNIVVIADESLLIILNSHKYSEPMDLVYNHKSNISVYLFQLNLQTTSSVDYIYILYITYRLYNYI